MASLSDTIAAMKGKTPAETAPGTQQRFSVQYINYSNLNPSAYNFYPLSEIEELADAIEVAGGVLQPLLVRRKAPGRYEIVAGHRRWTAAKYLAENGRQQYAMLPCHVQDGNELTARINLIVTNSQREKDAFTKMKEVQELEILLRQLAEGSEEERRHFYRITGLQEGEKVTARILRKVVAKQSGISETNVARLKHIDSSLEPELKEALEAGQIGITAADELARLNKEKQKKAAEQIRRGEKPERKTAKKKEQAAWELSKEETDANLSGKMILEKESDPIQLAKDFLTLYRRQEETDGDAWHFMHERLAGYFEGQIAAAQPVRI